MENLREIVSTLLLGGLLVSPFLGAWTYRALWPRLNHIYDWVAFAWGLWIYSLSLFLWIMMQEGSVILSHQINFGTWTFLNIHFCFGIDYLSLFFILLSTGLFPICFFAGSDYGDFKKQIFPLLFLIEGFLLLTFTVWDLFLFCVFFEALLIPMFFLIAGYGTRERRFFAVTYFYMYTLFGSIFLIFALYILSYELNTTSYTTILNEFALQKLGKNKQLLVWGLLFLSFATKIPIYPFHIWLPEAHVEAPTLGSVLLAGLLLKLGGYGVFRFLLKMEWACEQMRPFVLMICTLSVFYGSFMAIGQEDLKRIIAYSSIAHMNFALLGIFSKTIYGYLGGLCMMVSHGIVSPALFLAVGVLYERFGDRNVLRYGGLSNLLPSFITCFYIFILSNFSFPLTSNFVGEFLIFISLGVSVHQFVLIVVAGSSYFAMVYSMLLYSKMAYGGLKVPGAEEDARKNIKTVFEDISRKEAFVFYILMFGNFVFGIIPTVFLTYFYLAVCDWFVSAPTEVLEKQMSAEDLAHWWIAITPTEESKSKMQKINQMQSGPVVSAEEEDALDKKLSSLGLSAEDLAQLMMSLSREFFSFKQDQSSKEGYLIHQMAEMLFRKAMGLPEDSLTVLHYLNFEYVFEWRNLCAYFINDVLEDVADDDRMEAYNVLTLICEKKNCPSCFVGK